MRSAALIRQIDKLPKEAFKTITLDRPGPYRRPKVAEQAAVALSNYPGTVRQLIVTGLGREAPTVETVPGADPDRASFTTALATAQDLLVNATNVISDDVDLVGDIGRAVLAELLPPRRPRTSVRKVKSPLSRYNKKDPHRPERSNHRAGRHRQRPPHASINDTP